MSLRRWLSLTELMGFTFGFVTIHISMIWALETFARRNPEYMAEQPATVSRAISDPLVGPIFEFWMLLSSIAIFLGLSALLWMVREDIPKTKRTPKLELLGLFVWACLAASSTGLVILSANRFPTGNDWHMIGSYIFFIASFLMVVVGHYYFALARAESGPDLMRPASTKLRKIAFWAVLLIGLFYFSLFYMKDWELGALEEPLYWVYTTTEPILLSAFLFYFLIFNLDAWRQLRGG